MVTVSANQVILVIDAGKVSILCDSIKLYYVSEWEITVFIWVPKLAKGAPDFDMTMHASCAVVSTGDRIAHQML